MDGGGWRAAVHGVAEGQTRLSDVTFTFHFPALEKEMATHSNVLPWRIPGSGEPGGLPSLGSHRVGHDWSDLAVAVINTVAYYLLPLIILKIWYGIDSIRLTWALVRHVNSQTLFHSYWIRNFGYRAPSSVLTSPIGFWCKLVEEPQI